MPDINQVFPYCEMKKVVSDGQQMVYIPKFYIASGFFDGSTHPVPIGQPELSGKQFWAISDSPQEGYHCHPAFMLNGQECSGKELSCYIATKGSDGKPESNYLSNNYTDGKFWNNIPWTNIRTTANLRNTGTGEQSGWYAWDIYDHHMLALLMLIEYQTSDIQTQLGGVNNTHVVYRDINDPYGAYARASEWFWIDGFETDGSYNIEIYDNKGNHNIVNTGLQFGNNTSDVWIWPQTTRTESGSNYDLADLFICKSGDNNNEATGTFSDGQACYMRYAFGVYGSARSENGPFYFGGDTPSCFSGDRGFRLARYVL